MVVEYMDRAQGPRILLWTFLLKTFRVHALSESPDPRTPAHARAGDPWCQLDAAADAAGRWPVRGPWIGRLDGLGRIWLSISCWWSTAWAATAARAAAGESRGGFAGSTLQVGSGWYLR